MPLNSSLVNSTISRIETNRITLDNKAKAGLEAKEDFSDGIKLLKVTEKSRNGISLGDINNLNWVYSVMLINFKGCRTFHFRIVNPSIESLTSNDSLIIVTRNQIYQLNGKNSSIIKKAKAADFAFYIKKYKELKCCCNRIITYEERNSDKIAQILSGSDDEKNSVFKFKNDLIDENKAEKILNSYNLVYSFVIDPNFNEIGDFVIEETNSYSSLSIKILKDTQCFIFDFGSEVYLWFGNKFPINTRNKAIELGNKIFSSTKEDYSNENDSNPIIKSQLMNCGFMLFGNRPPWSIFSKVLQGSEHILFKSKFRDWPSEGSIPIKKSISNSSNSTIKVKKDTTIFLPKLSDIFVNHIEEWIIDGMVLNDGTGGFDSETGFQFKTVTDSTTIWLLINGEYIQQPSEYFGFFYSSEAYLIEWKFTYQRHNVKRLNGTDSSVDSGRDCLLYWYWQGHTCTCNEKGLSAIVTKSYIGRKAHYLRATQYHEMSALVRLFEGCMIINFGKQHLDFKEIGTYHLYWMQGKDYNSMKFIEIPLNFHSLRDNGAYFIVDHKNKRIYQWRGENFDKNLLELHDRCSLSFKQKFNLFSNISYELIKEENYNESDEFINLFDQWIKKSSKALLKPNYILNSCYFYNDGKFKIKQLTNNTDSSKAPSVFPLFQEDLFKLSQPALVYIECRYEHFLWFGFLPMDLSEENRKNSILNPFKDPNFLRLRDDTFNVIKDYLQESGNNEDIVYMVHAGVEPDSFKRLFSFWNDDPYITDLQFKAGRFKDECTNFLEISTNNLFYSIESLRSKPLPDGINPLTLEIYLNDVDFEKVFLMTKNNFFDLPKWKQLKMKKERFLY